MNPNLPVDILPLPVLQDILIKKGIVQKDDVLRGKGIDPDELRLKEAIVSTDDGNARSAQQCE